MAKTLETHRCDGLGEEIAVTAQRGHHTTEAIGARVAVDYDAQNRDNEHVADQQDAGEEKEP